MTRARPLVELCVESIAAIRIGEAAGVDRFELCAALEEGGVTPSEGTIEAARSASTKPIVVLVRSRRGDFLYDRDEIDVMRRDVVALASRGIDGIAIGALTAEGEIDRECTLRLIDAARPLRVTFHRAFDHVRNAEKSLDVLLSCGVDRLLTSGCESDALRGAPRIAELRRRAADALEVIAGGGIRASNIAEIVARTGVRAVHFSARETVRGGMRHRRDDLDLAARDALRFNDHRRPDGAGIARYIAALEEERIG